MLAHLVFCQQMFEEKHHPTIQTGSGTFTHLVRSCSMSCVALLFSFTKLTSFREQFIRTLTEAIFINAEIFAAYHKSWALFSAPSTCETCYTELHISLLNSHFSTSTGDATNSKSPISRFRNYQREYSSSQRSSQVYNLVRLPGVKALSLFKADLPECVSRISTNLKKAGRDIVL